MTVPFEPSQDVNMKSFLRKEMEMEENQQTEDTEEIDEEIPEEGGENDG